MRIALWGKLVAHGQSQGRRSGSCCRYAPYSGENSSSQGPGSCLHLSTHQRLATSLCLSFQDCQRGTCLVFHRHCAESKKWRKSKYFYSPFNDCPGVDMIESVLEVGKTRPFLLWNASIRSLVELESPLGHSSFLLTALI